VQAAERRVTITLPSRRVEPERVVAHLGPTNSGKTHAALTELAEKRAGVYAGPLRMLAQEAHRRLGEWIGAENVGLVTGEERVNEHAPVICSTVEMAPQSGELLVLDEVQWADDTERGLGLDAASSRGRLPGDPPARGARRASARESGVPRARAQGLRAQAAARVRR
jgi:hypothetical protein